MTYIDDNKFDDDNIFTEEYINEMVEIFHDKTRALSEPPTKTTVDRKSLLGLFKMRLKSIDIQNTQDPHTFKYTTPTVECTFSVN